MKSTLFVFVLSDSRPAQHKPECLVSDQWSHYVVDTVESVCLTHSTACTGSLMLPSLLTCCLAGVHQYADASSHPEVERAQGRGQRPLPTARGQSDSCTRSSSTLPEPGSSEVLEVEMS